MKQETAVLGVLGQSGSADGDSSVTRIRPDWAYDFCRQYLGLMLCCHHLEIFISFGTRVFSFCTGPANVELVLNGGHCRKQEAPSARGPLLGRGSAFS